MTTSDARKRIAEKSAPAQDTGHPSLAKYRQWHEEARQEAADLRAENQRLRDEINEYARAAVIEYAERKKPVVRIKGHEQAERLIRDTIAERDRLAGIVGRVKALADRRVYIYKGDLIDAIEGDGGESWLSIV